MNSVIPSGVLPASVTPFTPAGDIDFEYLAKLLAFFNAAKCNGVVLAGTNGEGPSLSAVEKRDLIRKGIELADGLPILLGIATPSLNEATWLATQASKAGAAGILLMPPSYFRNAPDQGVVEFMKITADVADIPVIAYNFPKYTGFTFTQSVLAELADHPNIHGFKDSSGDPANLPLFKSAAPDKLLFVGDETLLPQALSHGWSGTISGASNLIAPFITQYIQTHQTNPNQADALFQIILPAIQAIRSSPQPTSNKAVLAAYNVIGTPTPRLPLQATDPAVLVQKLKEHLGIDASNLGLP